MRFLNRLFADHATKHLKRDLAEKDRIIEEMTLELDSLRRTEEMNKSNRAEIDRLLRENSLLKYGPPKPAPVTPVNPMSSAPPRQSIVQRASAWSGTKSSRPAYSSSSRSSDVDVGVSSAIWPAVTTSSSWSSSCDTGSSSSSDSGSSPSCE